MSVGTARVGADGYAVVGKPITDITANGTTTPWKVKAGIYAFQVYGTPDTSSVKLQWELYKDAGFEDMPNTSGPYLASAIEGRIQLYNDTLVRVDVSSVGASTNLSVVLRGPGRQE